MSVVRIPNSQLRGLSGPETHPCEACGGDIRTHEWADLDANGFAVNCSKKEKLK